MEEKDLLEKIKFLLYCQNESQIIRLIKMYGNSKKYQGLQLLQADVSISLERAKKYARHQHYLGTQQLEFVEFEDWAKD
jgi:hypothetical protein